MVSHFETASCGSACLAIQLRRCSGPKRSISPRPTVSACWRASAEKPRRDTIIARSNGAVGLQIESLLNGLDAGLSRSGFYFDRNHLRGAVHSCADETINLKQCASRSNKAFVRDGMTAGLEDPYKKAFS